MPEMLDLIQLKVSSLVDIDDFEKQQVNAMSSEICTQKFVELSKSAKQIL